MYLILKKYKNIASSCRQETVLPLLFAPHRQTNHTVGGRDNRKKQSWCSVNQIRGISSSNAIDDA